MRPIHQVLVRLIEAWQYWMDQNQLEGGGGQRIMLDVYLNWLHTVGDSNMFCSLYTQRTNTHIDSAWLVLLCIVQNTEGTFPIHKQQLTYTQQPKYSFYSECAVSEAVNKYLDMYYILRDVV
jgi:hypothetical protein